jgi:hypothetical protein
VEELAITTTAALLHLERYTVECNVTLPVVNLHNNIQLRCCARVASAWQMHQHLAEMRSGSLQQLCGHKRSHMVPIASKTLLIPGVTHPKQDLAALHLPHRIAVTAFAMACFVPDLVTAITAVCTAAAVATTAAPEVAASDTVHKPRKMQTRLHILWC